MSVLSGSMEQWGMVSGRLVSLLKWLYTHVYPPRQLPRNARSNTTRGRTASGCHV